VSAPETIAAIATIRACAPNFRPLGDGWLVPGLLYRSGELASLDDSAWKAIESLGVRTLIDLRGTAESDHMPVIPPSSVRQVAIPIQPGDGTRFDSAADGLAAAALIGSAYRQIVTTHGRQIARVFQHLAEDDSLPAVLFCTAGKDRTGIVAALLLSALGGTAADIHADYALTNNMLTGEARRQVWNMSARLSTFGMPEGPIVDAMLAADPAYLEAALDAAAPLASYLIGLGIGAPLLSRLSARLKSET